MTKSTDILSPVPSPSSSDCDLDSPVSSPDMTTTHLQDDHHDSHCDSSLSLKIPLNDISNNCKQSTARELMSIIRQGKYEDLVYLLQSRPNTDLNIFVNGNTALHYCLILG